MEGGTSKIGGQFDLFHCTLRILSVGENGGNNALLGNDDDEAFNATTVSLRYTPRQMCLLSAKVGETIKK